MSFINRDFLRGLYIRKKRVFVSLIVLVLFLESTIYANNVGSKSVPFHKGETIEYDIKKFGLKIGEARIVFEGHNSIEGRDVLLIIFTSSAPRFFDEEKIYLDPVTYYPIMVKRNLNIFGRKEIIREDYSPSDGTVKILKYVDGKEIKQVIKKDRAMDNIYGFIYRYRKEGKFRIGETLKMFLPTKDIDITLIKQDKIWIAGKEYDTYFMQSIPSQYNIWFDTKDAKIPVRIDGSVGLKKTSMLLRSYKLSQ